MGEFLILLFFVWAIWRVKKDAKNVRRMVREEAEGLENAVPKREGQHAGGSSQPSASVFPDLFRELTEPTLGKYAGSLNVATKEGMDLCDPALGHSRERPEQILEEAEPVEASYVLPLPLTGDAMVQGFVMGEILAHPSQRQWAAGRRGV